MFTLKFKIHDMPTGTPNGHMGDKSLPLDQGN